MQPGPWTIGGLTNNAWAVASPSSLSDANLFSLQYFINYNLKKGWYIGTSPILTANWNAPSGNQWTVPLGGAVGIVLKLGPQPVNVSVGYFYNAVRPARFQFTFLFPKKPKSQQQGGS